MDIIAPSEGVTASVVDVEGGIEQAVADIGGAHTIVHKAATFLSGIAIDAAVEHAVRDVGRTPLINNGNEACVVASAVDTTVDGHAAAAVTDVGRAVGVADESGSVRFRSGDGARNVQFLDGGTVGKTERGAVVAVGRVADAERIALSVERAAETVVICTYHRGHAADVCAQLDMRAAAPVCRRVALVGEGVPLVSAADDVRVTCRAAASDVGWGLLPLCIERHGAVVRCGQVDDALVGRVAVVIAVLPSVEQLAGVGERVGPQLLRHVVGERLVAHRARAAVGVVNHHVLVGRPFGIKRDGPHRAGRDAGHGTAREARIVVPSAEGVARARRVGQRGHARTGGVCRGIARRVRAAVEHVGDAVVGYLRVRIVGAVERHAGRGRNA